MGRWCCSTFSWSTCQVDLLTWLRLRFPWSSWNNSTKCHSHLRCWAFASWIKVRSRRNLFYQLHFFNFLKSFINWLHFFCNYHWASTFLILQNSYLRNKSRLRLLYFFSLFQYIKPMRCLQNKKIQSLSKRNSYFFKLCMFIFLPKFYRFFFSFSLDTLSYF